MSQGLDPKDIPAKGRYDFTVTKAGFNKEGEWVVHATIDNGPYRMKRASTVIPIDFEGTPPQKFERFSAELSVEPIAKINGEWVPVEITHKDHDVVITYGLTEFDKPKNKPQVNFREHKDKFRR